jgi:hypothetical protein
MKPEMMGPILGPANGERQKMDMAFPLLSTSQISLKTAPALLIGTEANTPLRNRIMSSPGRLVTRALAIWRAV